MVEDQFIDPESDFSDEKNNYEEIVIKQIKSTADALSKDLTMSIKQDQKGGVVYKEDTRKTAINHIKTLRGLIFPFLEDKKEMKEMTDLEEEIETYIKELGEKQVLIPGRGKVQYSNMIHNVDSMPYNNLMEYKIDVFRKVFDLLVASYKKYKDEISAFSIE